MEGAPAAMHARTAAKTSGTEPPRELRMVATLFTLTLSRVTALIYTERALGATSQVRTERHNVSALQTMASTEPKRSTSPVRTGTSSRA